MGCFGSFMEFIVLLTWNRQVDGSVQNRFEIPTSQIPKNRARNPPNNLNSLLAGPPLAITEAEGPNEKTVIGIGYDAGGVAGVVEA